ncbi:MAG: ABC transporter substrate-binding protein [Syntrophales bacterium]|nr:ABC transporter substrate-binding protein [Syntrophales bacterium]MDY0045148.1 ABC transporter substrate-binding protein [Syntrophales bacterium]
MRVSYKTLRFSRLMFLAVILAIAAVSTGVDAAMPAFDINKMSDMSGYNPATFENPKGDVVKIGVVEAFSGPSAFNGQIFWLANCWLAYDYNKRGGIFVDGKKKKIAVIKGDHQAKPAVCKKAVEKLCLEDKVDLLFGSAGSHLTLIAQQVAGKYKTIFMNPLSMNESLMDGKNFNRYTFRTTITTKVIGLGLAYFYSKRPETKFYLLNQDYSYGHNVADAFKEGLKRYKPDAQIVGEDYHPLFLKDFAPYITKIQASGAEVIFTGDWAPDGQNLLIQSRQMKCMLPIANIYVDSPTQMIAVGVEGGVGMVNLQDYQMALDTPEMNKFIEIWNGAYKKSWTEPYNSDMWIWPISSTPKAINMLYWMWDVVERAGTTDPDKIIETWEGDTYKSFCGVVHMRACDHQVVRDVYVSEYEFPNRFYDNAAAAGKPFIVPAEYVTPDIPADLDRCKK